MTQSTECDWQGAAGKDFQVPHAVPATLLLCKPEQCLCIGMTVLSLAGETVT